MASLRAANLVFEDRTLLGTALPVAARARGLDPQEIAKLAGDILDSLRPGQGAATLAVLDALAAYVADYTQPKGPLRITLNPPGAIPLLGITLAVVTPANNYPFSMHRVGAGMPHRVVEHTGHWLQLDKPEEMNRILDLFLE